MKTYSVGLVALLFIFSSAVAHSQTAWLLSSRLNQLAVVKAQGQTTRDIFAFSGTAPNYGESRRVVVIVSPEGWAHVVDKSTAAVTSFQLASQPQFVGNPTADLSGPLSNMLVTDSYALFPSVRFFGAVPLNELGGQYDIVQMSLADGSLRSFPLPEDFQDPHLAQIGRTPIIYAPNSDRAWMFDSTSGRVVRILWNDDVADLRTKEVVGLRRAPDTPRAVIRYTLVPDAGIFRLSRLGELDRVLDEELAPVGAQAPSVSLAAAHDILTLKSGTTNGGPAIGVVKRQEGQMTFSYLDAFSLDVVWSSSVTQGAIPGSFYMVDDGSVFYIDRVTGAVNRLSQKDGGSTSWQLEPRQRASARILSIDLGR